MQLNISQIVLNRKRLVVIPASLSTTFHVEHFDQMFHVERYAIFLLQESGDITGVKTTPLFFREQCSTWNTRTVFQRVATEKRSTWNIPDL